FNKGPDMAEVDNFLQRHRRDGDAGCVGLVQDKIGNGSAVIGHGWSEMFYFCSVYDLWLALNIHSPSRAQSGSRQNLNSPSPSPSPQSPPAARNPPPSAAPLLAQVPALPRAAGAPAWASVL